jgi:uncharacterized protein YjiS (DUF1127 family)
MADHIPPLSLPNERTSTMAIFEIDVPSVPRPRPIRAIGAAFGSVMRSMQYARMIQSLSELSDTQLAVIELERADIPHRAHECVYGKAKR